MKKEFQYLLSEITIETDPKTGPILNLIDWHHRDYIEDVLIEVFNIEFDYLVENDDESVTLYFTDKADLNALISTVDQINEFHKSKNREFDLPSGT
ncbi:hypothetical protein [Alteromonas flava]|uniref:hypothetical protein n=1 Tax=Alteromonas flava TaxID=2048003 RepID=UPI000C292AE7|nr:hypothetical protein [Alteromonas flava]